LNGKAFLNSSFIFLCDLEDAGMIYEKFSLRKYNTFGLTVKADRFITFRMEKSAINHLRQKLIPPEEYLILGAGSNVLFTSDFHGTIIHPDIEGISVEEKKEDYVIISCAAGVIWDRLVELAVSYGFGGLENLSFIPGLVGAAPVQNIGAYGIEVGETIEKVRGISLADGSVREFSRAECKFGYRDSVFKGEQRGKYLITRVYFRLSTRPRLSLEFGSIKDEISKLGATSLANVRKIVINTRQKKLPDPAKIGNAGSFFKNPVVDSDFADDLKRKYQGLPLFRDHKGYTKLAAAWLIDQCGWKGKRIGNAGIHDKHALVIVNHGNATGKELYEFSEKVRKSVFEKFGIDLEREVEVVGII
jgi:UDP-N-acetylmuramate dehydrogenase